MSDDLNTDRRRDEKDEKGEEQSRGGVYFGRVEGEDDY